MQAETETDWIRDRRCFFSRWDDTWDGVWEVKTQIHKNGWAAEYKIPFHILRFSPRDEYVWGLQVTRDISRKKENAHWRLIKKNEPDWH